MLNSRLYFFASILQQENIASCEAPQHKKAEFSAAAIDESEALLCVWRVRTRDC